MSVSCRKLLKKVQTSLKLISYLPKMEFLYASMMLPLMIQLTLQITKSFQIEKGHMKFKGSTPLAFLLVLLLFFGQLPYKFSAFFRDMRVSSAFCVCVKFFVCLSFSFRHLTMKKNGKGKESLVLFERIWFAKVVILSEQVQLISH